MIPKLNRRLYTDSDSAVARGTCGSSAWASTMEVSAPSSMSAQLALPASRVASRGAVEVAPSSDAGHPSLGSAPQGSPTSGVSQLPARPSFDPPCHTGSVRDQGVRRRRSAPSPPRTAEPPSRPPQISGSSSVVLSSARSQEPSLAQSPVKPARPSPLSSPILPARHSPPQLPKGEKFASPSDGATTPLPWSSLETDRSRSLTRAPREHLASSLDVRILHPLTRAVSALRLDFRSGSPVSDRRLAGTSPLPMRPFVQGPASSPTQCFRALQRSPSSPVQQPRATRYCSPLRRQPLTSGSVVAPSTSFVTHTDTCTYTHPFSSFMPLCRAVSPPAVVRSVQRTASPVEVSRIRPPSTTSACRIFRQPKPCTTVVQRTQCLATECGTLSRCLSTPPYPGFGLPLTPSYPSAPLHLRNVAAVASRAGVLEPQPPTPQPEPLWTSVLLRWLSLSTQLVNLMRWRARDVGSCKQISTRESVLANVSVLAPGTDDCCVTQEAVVAPLVSTFVGSPTASGLAAPSEVLGRHSTTSISTVGSFLRSSDEECIMSAFCQLTPTQKFGRESSRKTKSSGKNADRFLKGKAWSCSWGSEVVGSARGSVGGRDLADGQATAIGFSGSTTLETWTVCGVEDVWEIVDDDEPTGLDERREARTCTPKEENGELTAEWSATPQVNMLRSLPAAPSTLPQPTPGVLQRAKRSGSGPGRGFSSGGDSLTRSSSTHRESAVGSRPSSPFLCDHVSDRLQSRGRRDPHRERSSSAGSSFAPSNRSLSCSSSVVRSQAGVDCWGNSAGRNGRDDLSGSTGLEMRGSSRGAEHVVVGWSAAAGTQAKSSLVDSNRVLTEAATIDTRAKFSPMQPPSPPMPRWLERSSPKASSAFADGRLLTEAEDIWNAMLVPLEAELHARLDSAEQLLKAEVLEGPQPLVGSFCDLLAEPSSGAHVGPSGYSMRCPARRGG